MKERLIRDHVHSQERARSNQEVAKGAGAGSTAAPLYGIDFLDRQRDRVNRESAPTGQSSASTRLAAESATSSPLVVKDVALPYQPEPSSELPGFAAELPSIQCQSSHVGSLGDAYEREADVAAQRVMLMPQADDKGSAPATTDPLAGAAPGRAGEPLSGPSRDFFESRFGRSFADVRLHTDANAARLNSAFSANALTHGQDIYFGAGQYQPATYNGQRLLAHELAHVVQQHGGASAGRLPLSKTAVGVMLQRDFRSSARRGLEMYGGMTDIGAPFARKLMRWRMIGLGSAYRTVAGDDWDAFMASRPEIQRAMATRFKTLIEGFALKPDTGSEWFGGWQSFSASITGVRLNELESMRLTLHGCHRIDIQGLYWKGSDGGVTTVKLGGVRFTWVDRADLHPGTATELSSGAVVDDREFTGAGWDYDIFINFTMPSVSTWTVSAGAATHVRGWPPVTGAPAAGWRG